MYTQLLSEKYPIQFCRQDQTKANRTLVLRVVLLRHGQFLLLDQVCQDLEKGLHVNRKFDFQRQLQGVNSQRGL